MASLHGLDNDKNEPEAITKINDHPVQCMCNIHSEKNKTACDQIYLQSSIPSVHQGKLHVISSCPLKVTAQARPHLGQVCQS